MSLPLTGYRDTRLLRASGQSQIYETVRRADGHPVIAKVFDLGVEEIEPRVEHEFALLRALDVEGVVRALELQRVGEQLVLLLDRAPGVNLAVYCCGRPLQLDRFMPIAVQLADILTRIHARRIIHRDIKPTNIVIDPASGRVALADFGISVLLENEHRHIYDPAVLEGTLPYLSPEQTGRTGRPVDFRSDLYSLGVTFYELLTGRRPFEYAAPLELIHAHLARVPAPPTVHRPGLPDGLVRVVNKLLAKAPEHRYQTAAGLAADLRHLERLSARADEGASLVLGSEDTPHELQLPHQLYGRAAEREGLAAELERVTQTDSARLVLVSGPAGIGKSALIADFEVTVAGYSSYVGHGKFDRDRPYSGFVQAFVSLIEQLLTESEARLARWRDRLGVALGGLGGAVIELVPILALVLGEQPVAPSLEPHEARNRVHLGLARFLSVFCEDRRPLVLVLEDLHWADNSSVALLEALLDGGRHGAMLLIGSVRPQEEPGQDPLDQLDQLDRLIEKLPDERVGVTRLGPLSRGAVEQLLADTLGRPASTLGALTELVTRKTDNNPLFIRQLLTHLYEAGLMRAGPQGWTYDDDAIEAAGIPDDALELMAAKLAALPEPARELLRRAACIADRFDFATLELVCDRPAAELTASLYDLVAAGLIDHVRGQYRFAHQGVREAARLEAGLELSQRVRWQIGQQGLALLDSLAGEGMAEGMAERLFEVVDHLDAGLAAAGELEPSARIELAKLNLRAGRRALQSAAYEPALRYLEQGLSLVAGEREAVAQLGEQAQHHQTVLDLAFTRAQVLAACGRTQLAEDTFTSLLAWRLRPREHARVVASWIAHLNLCGRNAEAVELGRAALARHGCTIEPGPTAEDARAQLERAWHSVRELDGEQLIAMPRCANERAAAVMAILTPTKNAAYLIDPNMYVVLISTQMGWLLRHGVCPGASLGIVQLAICVGSMLGETQGAIQTSRAAIALAERVDSSSTQVRVDAASQLFVAHLGLPFTEPLSRMERAYTRALEVGDFLWAGYTGAVALSMNLEVGMHLQVLGRLCERFEHELGTRASAEACGVASSLHAVGVVLGGRASEAALAQAHSCLQPEPLKAGAPQSRYSLYVTIANRALVSLVLGEADEALQLCARILDTVERVLFASWVIPRVALTAIVAAQILRAGGQPSASAGDRALVIVRQWAANSSDNYAHYLDLAEGLGAASDGSTRKAQVLLERARAHALERGCRWVEGLAAEQLAALADQDGLTGYAAGARQQAWRAYAAWGAGAKLEQLRAAHEQEFPIAVAADSGGTRSSTHRLETSSSSPGRRGHAGALDFDSVLRSVAAIRADLRLDQVTAAVLNVAITNAGADHGMLVLEHAGVFEIVAAAGLDSVAPRKPLALAHAGASAPTSLINYVLRTGKAVVLDDAGADLRFCDDPYVTTRGVLSLLGMPIIHGKRTQGVLVLENGLSRACFTPARLDVLQLISGQAAGALEHARVHDALREGEARWRSLVDGAPDMIALINENGEVEFVNRSGMQAVVPSTNNPGARGQMPQLFAGSSAAADWQQAVERVLEEGAVGELEIEVPRDVGPSRWYTARLAPIEFGGEVGTHRKAIAIATDISARKYAEADKRTLEAQMRQQQRLEAIGTLASGVAHEINNPIQGIMNYAELISANPHKQPLVEEFAAEIFHESERVATIVRNLLSFSRHEGLQPVTDTNLGALVDSTLSLIHSIVRKDQITLRISIPSDLPLVHCRGQQIQQIVMNLVTNARDALNSEFGGDSGRKQIEIRGERLLRPERASPGAWVRLTVEDHAAGIPADILPRIFDPFFTTKGRDQGTGLGLAVSHGIAREHGGELSVDSSPGHGTRFFLDLPACEA